jgi:hypothetical protein
MVDELGQSAHLRALRGQGRACVTMREHEFELQLGVAEGVLGLAGGKGFTVACEHEGIDRQEHEEVIRVQRIHHRTLVAFEADGNRLPLEPRAQGAHPLIDGSRRMLEAGELALVGAGGLQTDLVLGIGPVEADEGRERVMR